MFDPDKLITQRLKAIDASGIRKVFDLAKKLDNPINLSIGQPDFDVPQPIKDAAIAAIQQGHNSYTVTQGIVELRTQIDERFTRRFQNNGLWNERGALITSGVSGALVLALLTCVEPGDEVIIPDPYFVMYKHLVSLSGGKSVYADTYPDFQLTADRVEPLITDKTKLLILSSPSNPTGVVTSKSEMKKLTALCSERGVLLISDEIYDEFCYQKVDSPVGPVAPSPATFSDNVLVLRGYSKTYGMTGWRMGYAIGPKTIIEQMTKLQQYTFVCAPSMVQLGGMAAADVDISNHIEAYRHKRDMVIDKLADKFELSIPQGAFYAFPKVPGNMTGTQFVEKAIAQNVLTIPGCVFSERDTHFRISYACDDAILERGLNILVDLAG